MILQAESRLVHLRAESGGQLEAVKMWTLGASSPRRSALAEGEKRYKTSTWRGRIGIAMHAGFWVVWYKSFMRVRMHREYRYKWNRDRDLNGLPRTDADLKAFARVWCSSKLTLTSERGVINFLRNSTAWCKHRWRIDKGLRTKDDARFWETRWTIWYPR
jgi:hypothetical protein